MTSASSLPSVVDGKKMRIFKIKNKNILISPGRVKRKNAKKGDAGGDDDSGDE